MNFIITLYNNQPKFILKHGISIFTVPIFKNLFLMISLKT